MTKTQLAKDVSDLLKEYGIRKPISIPRRVFHISDDDGNSKDFVLKQINKTAMYTIRDVEVILGTCLDVIEECIARGEPVIFKGFGTWSTAYRRPRKSTMIGTGEDIVIDEHYVPKFESSRELKEAAKRYELSLDENLPEYEKVVDYEEDGDY